MDLEQSKSTKILSKSWLKFKLIVCKVCNEKNLTMLYGLKVERKTSGNSTDAKNCKYSSTHNMVVIEGGNNKNYYNTVINLLQSTVQWVWCCNLKCTSIKSQTRIKEVIGNMCTRWKLYLGYYCWMSLRFQEKKTSITATIFNGKATELITVIDGLKVVIEMEESISKGQVNNFTKVLIKRGSCSWKWC